MGLNVGDVITASDFIALKSRVKAECERRSYNGSVASYASSAYDYTVIPTSDAVPLPEHFNKIIIPMNAMIDTGRPQTQSGYLVRQLQSISNSLTSLESIEATASSSGCKASCTGLCQGTCTTGCTGCTGTCSGGCGSGCSTGCTGSCKGGCGSGCSTGCTGSCGTSCSQNCAESCYTLCTDGCKGNCKGTCGGSCVSACTITCKGYCKGSVSYDPAN